MWYDVRRPSILLLWSIVFEGETQLPSVTALDHRQQSEPASTEDYMSAMQRLLNLCGLDIFVLVFVCIQTMSILQLVRTDWYMTQHLISMFMDILRLSAPWHYTSNTSHLEKPANKLKVRTLKYDWRGAITTTPSCMVSLVWPMPHGVIWSNVLWVDWLWPCLLGGHCTQATK